MNKPTIIALVGASGSGKTTLSLYLQEKVDIPAICSYTTRPMREGEQNGREHWFVDKCVPDISKTLAYTNFGGHHYWTMPEQAEQHGICTYVIDEKGLIELKSKWSDKFQIVSVYITRAYANDIPEERRNRDKDRISLVPSDYDAIIHNNTTLQHFYKTAICTLAQIIK